MKFAPASISYEIFKTIKLQWPIFLILTYLYSLTKWIQLDLWYKSTNVTLVFWKWNKRLNSIHWEMNFVSIDQLQPAATCQMCAIFCSILIWRPTFQQKPIGINWYLSCMNEMLCVSNFNSSYLFTHVTLNFNNVGWAIEGRMWVAEGNWSWMTWLDWLWPTQQNIR